MITAIIEIMGSTNSNVSTTSPIYPYILWRWLPWGERLILYMENGSQGDDGNLDFLGEGRCDGDTGLGREAPIVGATPRA